MFKEVTVNSITLGFIKETKYQSLTNTLDRSRKAPRSSNEWLALKALKTLCAMAIKIALERVNFINEMVDTVQDQFF